MPPSCTTRAQNPAGSVSPPLSASQDGRPAFPVGVADGFGAAGPCPVRVIDPAAPRHVRPNASEIRFMAKNCTRLPKEGATHARSPFYFLLSTFHFLLSNVLLNPLLPHLRAVDVPLRVGGNPFRTAGAGQRTLVDVGIVVGNERGDFAVARAAAADAAFPLCVL